MRGEKGANPEIMSMKSGLLTIGGLCFMKPKFAAIRTKLLKEHPTEYLYAARPPLVAFHPLILE